MTMARTDIHYGREQALPESRKRISTDSTSLLRSKRNSRTSKAPDSEDRCAPADSGLAPVRLPIESVQEPSPFPEFSEQSYSPESKGYGSMRSAKAPSITAPGESYDGLDYRSQKGRPVKPKAHIKPMLRKMSREDAPSASIDLSRSSTEQEGLGIYLNMDRDRRRSESLTGMTYRRTASGLHHRSTSGTSQFSTATGSSGGKPGSQYVHPMRPTPRAYTPPLSQSYQTSSNDSDGLEDDELETRTKILHASETHRSVRASSGPVPRLSLQIEDDSFTRLSGISQSSVTGRPSFGYSRDNGSTLDAASPTSRASLDFVFRSRTRTSTDPVSRAATIQAARQAFEEKEAAKTRRFEKQQIKAEERQTRRRVKRNMSESRESPATHSSDEISEKPENFKASQPADPKGHEQHPSASWKSQSKSTWVLFMTWLRTRVFKFRRKLRR
ncbi:hypothetical protein N7462_000248 [Penicillium macrosclerotiorum]|uniref:uncharacterized protein n=1 Tax=Penicillium macrosclerotiorum TaxID=303699 RepID=UPI002546C230|nr:uncharacterized protein N7462_000248 [Penicillium macrosclerotiorum]KAJ5698243.1 hypothetical protein N7462_000248 [Penicillium macrosclerotiorum]